MDQRIVFGEVTPVVPARDVAAAIAFYTEKLGFGEVWRRGDPVTDGAVRRGAVTVMFFRCDDPKIAQWTAFRVRAAAVARWYEHCRARGVVHPDGSLHETPWGTREFVVLDQDGVGITFWEPLDGSGNAAAMTTSASSPGGEQQRPEPAPDVPPMPDITPETPAQPNPDLPPMA